MRMSSCLLARAKLAQYVDGLKPSSGGEQAGALIRAGYLATVKGPIKNALSNTAWGLTQVAAEPFAVAADVVKAHAQSALTFGRIKPHEVRQLAFGLDKRGRALMGPSIREGLTKARKLWTEGVDLDNAGDKFELRQTVIPKSPVATAFIRRVGHVMEMGDKPFFEFAYQHSLYQRSKLIGIRAGFKGKALGAETDRLLANPTDGMMVGALEDAQYATFKNPTVLGNALADVQSKLRQRAEKSTGGMKLASNIAQAGVAVVLPFSKVPSAVVSAGVDMTPIGLAKAAVQAAAKDPNHPAVIQKALGRSAVTASLIAAGMALAKRGDVATEPKNASERAMWEAEGKTDYSVKINGRWRQIAWLGPMAPAFLFGAFHTENSAEKVREGKPSDAGTLAADDAAFVGKVLTEASWLQSVNKIIDATKGQGGGQALAGALVPTPAIVGQVRTAVDPSKREVETLTDRTKNATPVVSRTLRPKTSVTGEPIPRRAPGIRGVLESFLDPSNPSTDRSTAVTKELDRLGVTIGQPSSTVRLGREKLHRSRAERAAVRDEAGPWITRALDMVISQPGYEKFTDEQKEKILRSVIREFKQGADARDKMRRLQRPQSTTP
jgi:hypothetical protein